jgi:predicted double-glycine peptidase
LKRPARVPGRRLLAPEVVQTSAMDCGPAALKCLLDGFGIPVSYGRLREACQTDVDGTSIDTMEEVAVQLGLEAEQIMLPLDHVLMPGGEALPALVVVRLPSGLTHFVVAWRRHGPLVQVMDPAIGRRWLTRSRFLDEVYVHGQVVPASAWCEWARSEAFLGALRRRLVRAAVDRSTSGRLIAEALTDPGWRALAALDASVRALDAVVGSRAVGGGAEAARVLEGFFYEAKGQGVEARSDPREGLLPIAYWSVEPAPADPDGEERLLVRGAKLTARFPFPPSSWLRSRSRPRGPASSSFACCVWKADSPPPFSSRPWRSRPEVSSSRHCSSAACSTSVSSWGSPASASPRSP